MTLPAPTPLSGGGGGLTTADIDTIAELNAILTDADLNTSAEIAALTPASLVPLASSTVSGTTDTLAVGDHARTNVYSNAALATVTIPTNGSVPLAIGFWVTLVSSGAAGVTLSTAGITLVGATPNTTIAQNEAMYLEKTATDTWLVVGGTAA